MFNIIREDSFKDGGTLMFTVSAFPKNRQIYVDRRIGSVEKGSLWEGHPSEGRRLTEPEIEEFWRILDTYYEYKKHTHELCLQLFKERGYKKPRPRIRMSETICECGGGGWSESSLLPNKVTCSACKKVYPLYIYIR